jgi:hypothetical protein
MLEPQTGDPPAMLLAGFGRCRQVNAERIRATTATSTKREKNSSIWRSVTGDPEHG